MGRHACRAAADSSRPCRGPPPGSQCAACLPQQPSAVQSPGGDMAFAHGVCYTCCLFYGNVVYIAAGEVGKHLWHKCLCMMCLHLRCQEIIDVWCIPARDIWRTPIRTAPKLTLSRPQSCPRSLPCVLASGLQHWQHSVVLQRAPRKPTSANLPQEVKRLEDVSRENTILKRAVTIQAQRLNEASAALAGVPALKAQVWCL